MPAPTMVCSSSMKRMIRPSDFLDLLQHGLEPLFKFAPVLCTGDQCAHIQGEDRLILQALRHVALDNPLGQPFGDGGFADAGLADQDGVVLASFGKECG